MAYDKTGWVNDSPPYMNQENMNKIEQGIADAHNGVYSLLPSMAGKPASNLPYFETVDNRPVWWAGDGIGWVDAMGNPLDTVYITEDT